MTTAPLPYLAMRSNDFHDLVSGRCRGIRASLLRGMLALAEGPYRLGVAWRNRRYDQKPELSHEVDAPVISVGNLTLGGTGKTPMVKWLARWFRQHDVRVALVSRGYGASQEGAPNDEAMELEESLPDVPHLQNKDRVAACETAIDELLSELILVDDGFQHRRLRRDLDIVLLDATEPWGFGRVFPRGALREPVRSLRRADVVCLTRSDLVDEPTQQAIRKRVERVAPEAIWCRSQSVPTALVAVDQNGNSSELAEAPRSLVNGKRVVAFCGIGNPPAFRATLKTLGADVVELIDFADHHAYTAEDIERLATVTTKHAADLVLCTHKDLVKVRTPDLGGVPLRAVAIGADIVEGRDALEARLRPFVDRAMQQRSAWEPEAEG